MIDAPTVSATATWVLGLADLRRQTLCVGETGTPRYVRVEISAKNASQPLDAIFLDHGGLLRAAAPLGRFRSSLRT